MILWQVWAFVAPGLHTHEKRFGVASGCLFFSFGTYFGFAFLFPLILSVLIKFGVGVGGVSAMLSMDGYLSLALHLLLAFDLVFELPVVIVLLARLGVVDYLWLRQNRKYMVIDRRIRIRRHFHPRAGCFFAMRTGYSLCDSLRGWYSWGTNFWQKKSRIAF